MNSRFPGHEPSWLESRIPNPRSESPGYRGREIAEFLQKDSAAVTGYARDQEEPREMLDKLLVAWSRIRSDRDSEAPRPKGQGLRGTFRPSLTLLLIGDLAG